METHISSSTPKTDDLTPEQEQALYGDLAYIIVLLCRYGYHTHLPLGETPHVTR